MKVERRKVVKVEIMRGLPGSGKTTWIKKLVEQGLPPALVGQGGYVCVSADDYFMKDGEYKFDPARIGHAHAVCFRNFLDIITLANLSPELNYVVVDNTNISAFEIAPYVQAANAFGIESEIITVWCEPMKAAARNVHQVPATVVLQMYQRLIREELPPFWKHRIIAE